MILQTPSISQTMQAIRAHQAELVKSPSIPLSVHPRNPKTLLIACIDARIDPKEIGIQNALIYRSIAALAPAEGDPDNDMSNVLKYATEHDIERIVVMGHTLCGGLKACCSGADHEFHDIAEHLSPLHQMREKIVSSTPNNAEQIHRLEEASVRESVDHLKNYQIIKTYQEELAKKGKQLTFESWVIDTQTRAIRKFNDQNNAFEPMPYGETIEDGRSHRISVPMAGEDRSKHAPEILILGGINANDNPAPYGKALICRDLMRPDGLLNNNKKSAVQFAVEVMKDTIKDIAVVIHADKQYKSSEDLLKAQMKVLLQDPMIKKAQQNGIQIHGWLYDKNLRLSELQGDELISMVPNPPARKFP